MAIGVKVRKGSATNARRRRHFRLRKKIAGSATRPRLVVSRSTRHLFVQVINDELGQTIVSASTMEADFRNSTDDKTAKSRAVGELIAKRATAAGVSSVVFDRAGNQYHGRLAALADAARSNGLEF
jgi:large subunit ribosomal protein L18